MPTSMGEGHQSENSEAETEEDEEDEERKDQVEFVSRTRHAFDSFFGRLQEAMDESDSEADTTMTPMLRSVNHPQAIVHEERNEGRAQEGGPHHDPHPSSRDIEMGPRDHSHNV
jgi:TATA-binding protein-associated factor Taf7